MPPLNATPISSVRAAVCDDATLKETLAEYFSDAKVAQKRMRRFLEETNRETQRLRAASKADERARGEILVRIERIKKAILDGASGPTMPKELTEQERQLAEVEAKIVDTEAGANMRPAMMPPAEVIATLHREGFYETRAAYRQLVSRVELRSVRRKGSRMVDHWIATIERNRIAGITGLPEFITIGRSHKGECQ